MNESPRPQLVERIHRELARFKAAARVGLGFVCFVGMFGGVGAERFARGQDSASPVILTNVEQIASILLGSSEGRYEARIDAVVLYVSPGTRRLYVQSGDRGVQVNLTSSVAAFRVGQHVAVSGEVIFGEPTLRLARAAAEDRGDTALPKPKRVSVHRLVKGEEAFRYVTVRGMVRDMYSTRESLVFLLTQDGYPFEVAFQHHDAPLPQGFMDAEIDVTGFCYPFYGSDGRLRSVRFHAIDTNQVQVLTPGIADRFEGRPMLSIAEAARLPNSLKARYRVSGTVTACRRGLAFWIDDGTGVMHVDQTMAYLRPPAGAQGIEREPQTSPVVGERVEVIGARHNWFSLAPSLMATEYRRMGAGQPVEPVETTLAELQDGLHAGRLVTLTAQLADAREWGTSNLRQHLSVVLRVDNDIFQAIWEGDAPVKWDLEPDEYVRITGVNDAEGSPNRKRATFKLILRSPTDVVSAPPPPFWARKEVRRIALAMSVVAVLAGGWIGLQRWQMRRLERSVAQRTADLRASEARKAAVLETALDSIVTIDREGRILDFNPAAESTFGYRREEVLGREMAELMIPEAMREQHREGLRRAVDTGTDRMVGRRIEVPALRRDGEEFMVELALARIETSTGPIFTAHIQDISERKRAEQERERALAHEKELGELKSRFVSMVSHEFRTPLGIIMSSAEILDAYLDRLSEEERRSNLRDIAQASKHMAWLMEEVLLLSRVEAGKMVYRPAPLALGALCARLADEVTSATGGRCTIDLSVPEDLAEAQGDEALLRHIFTNLLTNAVKYSSPGGRVEFAVEAEGHLAVLAVRDQGIGIPEADARQLFQAFHRGRNVGDTPGTGLGMVIVKRCVELHGGKIAFDSREGEGTRFVVALPLFQVSHENDGGTTQIFRKVADTQNLTPIV